MRRAATSAYTITLPPGRTAEVISIDGRQTVARRGLYFVVIGRHRRSVYQQFDGSTELADLCTCSFDWQPDFEVQPSAGCRIDQHRLQALHRVTA